MGKKSSMQKMSGIPKIATQIEGLDEVLHGGLPQGRTTLISGGPGSGKTLLALEFAYRSALSGVPGIFLTFEETAESIRQNTLSFGWDLASLEKAGKLFLMGGQVEPLKAISGDFNLKGLLAIIEGKSKEMGAERIVIDALDVLLLSFKDPSRERQQIQLLHQWLNKEGMTAILTAKNLKTTDASSAYNHLDFMSDCVIYLDQRVSNQVSTKRIQIIKYRGSSFGSNEYPFLVTDNGLFFDPISDMQLHYPGPSQRISSGNPSLDEILGGGYQGGSCILISGATGTGKTSLASTFARGACENGQKVLYINFEESPDGMLAGMHSIGIDLRPFIESASLRIMSVMPESRGIEEHLYDKITAIRNLQPQHLVVDAISACQRIAGKKASFDFIMRLVHFCKKKSITTVLLNQAKGAGTEDQISGIGISSIIDTIITLRYKDTGNETHRILQVKKSRGSKHSNRYHNYLLTDNGIQFHTVQPKQTILKTD
jgi:circadian clock protein KaiC